MVVTTAGLTPGSTFELKTPTRLAPEASDSAGYLKANLNRPPIFRESVALQMLRRMSPEELLARALEELQEQVNDDIDLEEGRFFFHLALCPKTDREAVLAQAKKLDSVIDEESDEDNVTHSQYSMQKSITSAPGQRAYSKITAKRQSHLADPKHGNRSVQSAASVKSLASLEDRHSNNNQSSLFVVPEDESNSPHG